MRNNYKSGTKQMTDEQVLGHIFYHHKNMTNDKMNNGTTTHLTKALHFENEAKKRGYTEEQITDYCNEQYTKEYAK